jgi:hypothetical protein
VPPRVGNGVDWPRHAGGGTRLAGHTGEIYALAECGGRICSASWDGTIRVWARAARAEERALLAGDPVYALAAWDGGRALLSGHEGGAVRAWCVATGGCEGALAAHGAAVLSLAVCGGRLVSGARDGTLRVWAGLGGAGAGAAPAWERALAGHGAPIGALAVWRGAAVSGASDGSAAAWDVASGARQAILLHGGSGGVAVTALAVVGDRVYAACGREGIREWAAGTWEPLRAAGGGAAAAAGQFAYCLAASGGRLVSGSVEEGGAGEARCEVRVWGLGRGALAVEAAVRQPPGGEVSALLALRGELWAGVGMEVVVWGGA